MLTVLVGGGAFAFYQIDPLHVFRSGPQAAEAIPANALLYAGFDLNPSAEQKVNALRFLNHFPAFRNNSGLGDVNADVRSAIFGKALTAMRCPGLTYGVDVKPWIGNKFAVAAMPPTSGGSSPVVIGALEVTNQSAAKTGLSKIRACVRSIMGGPTFGFAFEGDYALLAQTQVQAVSYAKAAASSSLADSAAFTADMKSLGDLGVATMWVDVSRAVTAFGQVLPVSAQLGNLDHSAQRAAATFRFSGDSAEIVTSVLGSAPAVTHGENQIVKLPSSTVFAVSEAGGGQRVGVSWKAIKQGIAAQGVDVGAAISQLEARTGLRLPDDLRTLFGNNLLFAMDRNGLGAGGPLRGDLSSIDAGFRFTNNPAALNALYAKVRRLIEQQSTAALPVAKVDASDGIAVATNARYAKVLAGLSGGLGESPGFQSVVQNAANMEFVAYFNWNSVEQTIVSALHNSGAPQQVIDNLRPLRAIGATSVVSGHYTVGSIKVSVDD